MNVQRTFKRALDAVQAQDVGTAETLLQDILQHDPEEVNALRMLGSLHLAQKKVGEAESLLSKAVAVAPRFEAAVLDLAKCRYARGDAAALTKAADDLRLFLQRPGAHYQTWQLYADVLFAADRPNDARAAQRKAIETDPHHAQIGAAIQHLGSGRARDAENVYRGILKANAANVHALVGLASIALDKDVTTDAERLLDHAMRQSPNYSHVERARARLYMKQGLYDAAEQAALRATELSPEAAECWTSLGTVYAWGLKQDDAARALEKSLTLSPEQPRVHLSLGHVQKALGQRDAAEHAYRAALAHDPALGEAWWSLADLKTFQFRAADMTEMTQLLDRGGLETRERDLAALHFALGKAHEDRARYDDAFAHYASGNRLRASQETFHVQRFRHQIEAAKRVFKSSTSAVAPAETSPTPIFVVGLPRSGSTLVDQILASHSQIQGTMELPHILGYVRELGHDQDAPRDKDRSAYPGCVAAMSDSQLSALGGRYLEETAAYHQGAPYFVDKMPNNYLHLGLIARMLPQARFIDTRRHPMGCCFSIFKQNFARGQAFGYDFETLGAYYRGYLELMAHWRSIMPERVVTVVYEHLVDDTEAQIRDLLAHCGVAFEPACLAFHRNERVVRTASAEQVRQPIYASGKEQWRHFAEHLGPLEAALGPALTEWLPT